MSQIRRYSKEHELFLRLESSLLERSILRAPALLDEHAYRHVRRGFDLRLLMMRCSRIFLLATGERDPERPLGPYEVPELNVHLNAYYLNLRGALDNLAWALNYELKLLPDVTEDKGRGRGKCYLFGRAFRAAIRPRSQEAADQLARREAWGMEIKDLRDPAAHRAPLTVIGGVLFDDTIEEFRRLEALAGAPDEELAGLSRAEYLHRAQKVSTYVPVFDVGSRDGTDLRRIGEQVAHDHRIFLEVSLDGFALLWEGSKNS